MIEFGVYEHATFWSRVNVKGESLCWQWNGAKDKAGYGKWWHAGKEYKSHRIAIGLVVGWDELNAHQMVRHLCHNPPCCNPNHLALGDGKDNAKDSFDAGRVRLGPDRWNTKLSCEDIIDIKRNGLSTAECAAKYSCSKSHIYNIRAGYERKHV